LEGLSQQTQEELAAKPPPCAEQLVQPVRWVRPVQLGWPAEEVRLVPFHPSLEVLACLAQVGQAWPHGVLQVPTEHRVELVLLERPAEMGHLEQNGVQVDPECVEPEHLEPVEALTLVHWELWALQGATAHRAQAQQVRRELQVEAHAVPVRTQMERLVQLARSALVLEMKAQQEPWVQQVLQVLPVQREAQQEAQKEAQKEVQQEAQR